MKNAAFNVLGFVAWFGACMVAATPVAKPERVVVYVRPLVQWTCAPQERREYLNACAHRERMDGILRAAKPAKARPT
jgi:hypothetical protein